MAWTETLAEFYAAVQQLTAEGKGAQEIARCLGVHKNRVYAAWKASGPPKWEKGGFTCETCHRTEPGPSDAAERPCPHCPGTAYPPLSDAEVLRRLNALVKRLEAEEHAGPAA